jgi:hypothetical protein
MHRLSSLELEEKILNLASIITIIGVFLPWMGGEWLGGESTAYSGFAFYTSFLGITVLILHIVNILITAIPLTGGPILVRKRNKGLIRFLLTGQATVLILASLSVLTKVTFEFSRMEVRFGILVSLIASMVATLYAFLRYQEQRRSEVHELFHHPDDTTVTTEKEDEKDKPPHPSPPPPPEAEEHRLHR